MKSERSKKHEEARGSIPDDLKPAFDALVDDYTNAAMIRHGAGYVSYMVLADLINAGWRRVRDGTKP